MLYSVLIQSRALDLSVITDQHLSQLLGLSIASYKERAGRQAFSLFGWPVADGWCWFVLREEYCWLVANG
jgi:hypothetical protein